MDRFRRHTEYTPIELTYRNAAPAPNATVTSNSPNHPKPSLRQRLSPTIAVLFTTGCAVAVWSLRLSHWKNSHGFYIFVNDHRVAIQVFINIISSLLTLLWYHGLCSTINLITRNRFARKDVPIKTLRLWTLISQARIEFNISLSNFLACAAFCLISYLSAWLWTGALTPQTSKYTIDAKISVPKTGTGAYPFLNLRLDGMPFDWECWQTTQANGTFTSCPGKYQSGTLLTSASSATTVDGSPRNHSKISDTTAYQYTGRSYGVGSSVGLSVDVPDISTLYGYNYSELGYLTMVNCAYNNASQWVVGLEDCPSPENLPGETLPCSFLAYGCFPNSQLFPNGTCNPEHLDYYAQSSFGPDNAAVVAMGATNSDNATEYYLAMAATPAWAQYDKLHCQIFFKPTWFDISVSILDTGILVTPIRDGSDPEPRGMLRSKVLDSLNVISMVEATLYTTTVGESLKTNARNYVSSLTNGTEEIRQASNEEVLAAVTDSVEAMVDDILQSFASAALTQPGAFEQSDVLFTAFVVEIGEYPFIIAVIVYQFLALIGVVAALIISKFWKRVPVFDYSDIASMSTAAYLGSSTGKGGISGILRDWDGDPDHVSLNDISARFQHTQAHKPPIVQIVALEAHAGDSGEWRWQQYNTSIANTRLDYR